MDNISIIIRNKNEADFIGFAIQSCLDFFNKPEIIIVNNNSTDDSMDVVQNFNNRTKIIVKNINNYMPGESINEGVKLATKKYILVLSGHTQIIQMDFETVKKELENHLAVFGQQIPIHRGKKITPGYIWSNFGNKSEINKFSKIEDRLFLHNAFCFYKKDTLIKFPMPEHYAGKEDRFWAKSIVDKKYSFFYTPLLKCYHFWTKRGATWKGLI
jgi:glycosyltransferase involved in cell wall biosynthesis